MSSTAAALDILEDQHADERSHIVEMLTQAYWMELETVINYMAASINPDGVRARAVASALADDITEELGHARQFGERIKELYGVVPSSVDFTAEQRQMRPPREQTELVGLIRAVIEAETAGIRHYREIIGVTEEVDPVTQDMVISILHDEERHRRLFEGFLREYEHEREV